MIFSLADQNLSEKFSRVKSLHDTAGIETEILDFAVADDRLGNLAKECSSAEDEIHTRPVQSLTEPADLLSELILDFPVKPSPNINYLKTSSSSDVEEKLKLNQNLDRNTDNSLEDCLTKNKTDLSLCSTNVSDESSISSKLLIEASKDSITPDGNGKFCRLLFAY